MTAEELIEQLALEPLPGEGGYYRETYRSGINISCSDLPEIHQTNKQISTAIYYLLTPESCSVLHRLPADEVYHFYLGDPVTMLNLHPDGEAARLTLGNDLAAGQLLQVIVPAETWQGSMLQPGGSFALMGTTMAPGFDFDDFEAGDRKSLIRAYPDLRELIEELTHG